MVSADNSDCSCSVGVGGAEWSLGVDVLSSFSTAAVGFEFWWIVLFDLGLVACCWDEESESLSDDDEDEEEETGRNKHADRAEIGSYHTYHPFELCAFACAYVLKTLPLPWSVALHCVYRRMLHVKCRSCTKFYHWLTKAEASGGDVLAG